MSAVEHEDHCGDVDCRGCADLVPRRRGVSVDHGGRQPRREADRLEPLPPAELARLRALVACHGCYAVREDVTWKNGRIGTTVRHSRHCPVRAAELAERRRVALRRGRSAAAARGRTLDGPGLVGSGPPPPLQEPTSTHQQDHATVTVPDEAGGSLDTEGVAS